MPMPSSNSNRSCGCSWWWCCPLQGEDSASSGHSRASRTTAQPSVSTTGCQSYQVPACAHVRCFFHLVWRATTILAASMTKEEVFPRLSGGSGWPARSDASYATLAASSLVLLSTFYSGAAAVPPPSSRGGAGTPPTPPRDDDRGAAAAPIEKDDKRTVRKLRGLCKTKIRCSSRPAGTSWQARGLGDLRKNSLRHQLPFCLRPCVALPFI